MITRINDILQIISKLIPKINQSIDLEHFLPIQQIKLTKLPHSHTVLILQSTVEAFFLVHAIDFDNENNKKTNHETHKVLSHLECFDQAAATITSTMRDVLDKSNLLCTYFSQTTS
ncbi:unnamed protein product, partial [Rotaria sp. Silwood1]